MPSFYEEVYRLTRQIPPGRVTNYGTIAALAGSPNAARAVGYALRALPEGTDVPWQRVINARGTISTHGVEQRRLLEQDGVIFDQDGSVDLARWGWDGNTG